MNLKLSEIAAASGGKLVGCDMIVTKLVTDSRKIEKNAIFAPERGIFYTDLTKIRFPTLQTPLYTV